MFAKCANDKFRLNLVQNINFKFEHSSRYTYGSVKANEQMRFLILLLRFMQYQAFLKILYDIWYINKCNVQNIL